MTAWIIFGTCFCFIFEVGNLKLLFQKITHLVLLFVIIIVIINVIKFAISCFDFPRAEHFQQAYLRIYSSD